MHNVGSIFRNAAAFGIKKLYLTGITASPPRKEIAKVALGAEEMVSWEAGEIKEIIKTLKSSKVRVIGLENAVDAVEIHALKNNLDGEEVALVLGSEVDGIDEETLARIDGTVIIPMQEKRSLNVAVASGIAMHVLQENNLVS